jgi:hypothetical protein
MMPTAQANHPAYLRVTEPAFRGTFAIFAWFNDKAHVVINDDEGDDAMEVVWEVGALGHGQALSAKGHFRVMEKDFSRRMCRVHIGDLRMTWLLDALPSEIQRAQDVED